MSPKEPQDPPLSPPKEILKRLTPPGKYRARAASRSQAEAEARRQRELERRASRGAEDYRVAQQKLESSRKKAEQKSKDVKQNIKQKQEKAKEKRHEITQRKRETAAQTSEVMSKILIDYQRTSDISSDSQAAASESSEISSECPTGSSQALPVEPTASRQMPKRQRKLRYRKKGLSYKKAQKIVFQAMLKLRIKKLFEQELQGREFLMEDIQVFRNVQNSNRTQELMLEIPTVTGFGNLVRSILLTDLGSQYEFIEEPVNLGKRLFVCISVVNHRQISVSDDSLSADLSRKFQKICSELFVAFQKLRKTFSDFRRLEFLRIWKLFMDMFEPWSAESILHTFRMFRNGYLCCGGVLRSATSSMQTGLVTATHMDEYKAAFMYKTVLDRDYGNFKTLKSYSKLLADTSNVGITASRYLSEINASLQLIDNLSDDNRLLFGGTGCPEGLNNEKLRSICRLCLKLPENAWSKLPLNVLLPFFSGTVLALGTIGPSETLEARIRCLSKHLMRRHLKPKPWPSLFHNLSYLCPVEIDIWRYLEINIMLLEMDQQNPSERHGRFISPKVTYMGGSQGEGINIPPLVPLLLFRKTLYEAAFTDYFRLHDSSQWRLSSFSQIVHTSTAGFVNNGVVNIRKMRPIPNPFNDSNDFTILRQLDILVQALKRIRDKHSRMAVLIIAQGELMFAFRSLFPEELIDLEESLPEVFASTVGNRYSTRSARNSNTAASSSSANSDIEKIHAVAQSLLLTPQDEIFRKIVSNELKLEEYTEAVLFFLLVCSSTTAEKKITQLIRIITCAVEDRNIDYLLSERFLARIMELWKEVIYDYTDFWINKCYQETRQSNLTQEYENQAFILSRMQLLELSPGESRASPRPLGLKLPGMHRLLHLDQGYSGSLPDDEGPPPFLEQKTVYQNPQIENLSAEQKQEIHSHFSQQLARFMLYHTAAGKRFYKWLHPGEDNSSSGKISNPLPETFDLVLSDLETLTKIGLTKICLVNCIVTTCKGYMTLKKIQNGFIGRPNTPGRRMEIKTLDLFCSWTRFESLLLLHMEENPPWVDGSVADFCAQVVGILERSINWSLLQRFASGRTALGMDEMLRMWDKQFLSFLLQRSIEKPDLTLAVLVGKLQKLMELVLTMTSSNDNADQSEKLLKTCFPSQRNETENFIANLRMMWDFNYYMYSKWYAVVYLEGKSAVESNS